MTSQVSVHEVLPAPASEKGAGRGRGRGRGILWVLVFALAGLALGLAIGARMQTRITAEVDLLVTPLPGNAYSTANAGSSKGLEDLETESHLPASDAVLRAVASDGGGSPGIAALRRRLNVSVVPNTEVITIRFAAETPAQARLMATRIAQATLDERIERATVANTARLEVINEKLDALELEKAALDPRTVAQLTVLSQRQVALNAQQRQALTPILSSGQIISTAARGDGGAGKLKLIIVGGCTLAASLLGLWVALGSRRRSVDDPEF